MPGPPVARTSAARSPKHGSVRGHGRTCLDPRGGLRLRVPAPARRPFSVQPLQTSRRDPVTAQHVFETGGARALRPHNRPAGDHRVTGRDRAAPEPGLDWVGESAANAIPVRGQHTTSPPPRRRSTCRARPLGRGTPQTRACRCRARRARSFLSAPCADDPGAAPSGPRATATRGRSRRTRRSRVPPVRPRRATRPPEPFLPRRSACSTTDSGPRRHRPRRAGAPRRRSVDAVGDPTAIRQPADVFEVVDGALAERLRGEAILVGSSARWCAAARRAARRARRCGASALTRPRRVSTAPARSAPWPPTPGRDGARRAARCPRGSRRRPVPPNPVADHRPSPTGSSSRASGGNGSRVLVLRRSRRRSSHHRRADARRDDPWTSCIRRGRARPIRSTRRRRPLLRRDPTTTDRASSAR